MAGSRFLALMRNLFRGRRVESDLDDELAAAADILAAEHRRAGLTPDEAQGRFSGMATGDVTAMIDERPERLAAAFLNHTLFPLLGLTPEIGRGITAEEDRPGAENVVVLTHDLWQSRFADDPEVLGHPVTLDGEPHTIVGVMPAGFFFPLDSYDLLVPFRIEPDLVRQRTAEFGVRIAIGARPLDISTWVLRRGLTLTALGIGLGLGAASLLTGLLSAQLYEISPHDPATLAGVTLLMLAVAVVACWVPARRATRLDPLVALRHE